MQLSSADKALNIALVLSVAVVYAVFAFRFLRKKGGLARVLRLREPAVFLDSARLVVALAWLPLTPSVARVGENLVSGVPVDNRTILLSFVDLSQLQVEHVHVAVWAFRGGLVLLALGILPRLSALVAALGYTFAWSVAYGFTHAGHNHVVAIVLLVLSGAPHRGPTVVDYLRAVRNRTPLEDVGTYPAYFRFFVFLAVVTAYFQAGVEKLLRSGPHWMNGLTLQGFLRKGTELGLQLSEEPVWLLTLLSVGIVLWELLFAFVLFDRRLRAIGAATAYAFHWGMVVFLGPPFVALRRSLWFLFSPYEVYAWLRGRHLRPTESAESVRWGPIALLVLLTALQWIPTATRMDKLYPFFNYAMFNGAAGPGDIQPVGSTLLAGPSAGELRPVSPREVGVPASTLTEQIFMRFVSEHPRNRKFRKEGPEYCRALLDKIRTRNGTTRHLALELVYYRAGDAPKRTTRVFACAVPGA